MCQHQVIDEQYIADLGEITKGKVSKLELWGDNKAGTRYTEVEREEADFEVGDESEQGAVVDEFSDAEGANQVVASPSDQEDAEDGSDQSSHAASSMEGDEIDQRNSDGEGG